MGEQNAGIIRREDVRGSRMLLGRRAAESVDLDGTLGGAVQFACTFQQAYEARFIWARLLLRLETPDRIHIVDLAPREVLEEKPIQFTVDGKGKLRIRYQVLDASVEKGTQKQFAIYHCKVQGSGESTALARRDFNENPYRKDGLGPEQVLALTVPVTGDVTGTVSVSARLVRSGVQGGIDTIRDLILGPQEHHYRIVFTVPMPEQPTGLRRFLRLS